MSATAARPATTAPAKTLADEILERTTEYVPFGQRGGDRLTLSVSIVRRFLCEPTRSGKVCSDADAIRFIMMCKARQLNPFEGDAFLLGYDTQDGAKFSLVTAHQAFLKRAEGNPNFDGMESGVVVLGEETDDAGELSEVLVERQGDLVEEGERIVGGWARVFRKDRKIPTYRRLSLATFSTGQSRWKKDPAGMIVKCAEADALRSSFPTTIGALYLEQEFGLDLPSAEAIREAVEAPVATSNGQARRGRPPKDEARPGGDAEPAEAEAPESLAGRVDEMTQCLISDHILRLKTEPAKVRELCRMFGSSSGIAGLKQTKALELVDYLASIKEGEAEAKS